MDRGAWQTTVHGVTKELDPTEATKHLTPSPSECDYLWVFKEVIGTALVVC